LRKRLPEERSFRAEEIARAALPVEDWFGPSEMLQEARRGQSEGLPGDFAHAHRD
jgi:hypothetical protein